MDPGADELRSPPVVVISTRQPKSYNAKGRGAYQDHWMAIAKESIANPLGHRQLYSKIYYFHRGRSPIDADNLSKPIIDSLREIVYRDDSQVTQRLVAKIAIDEDDYVLEFVGAPNQARLIGLLADDNVRHVVYVEVGLIDSLLVRLGGM